MTFPLTSAGLVNCEKNTGDVPAGTTYVEGFAVAPNGKLQIDDAAVGAGAVYNAGIACKPNGVVYVTTSAPTRWVGGIPVNDAGALCVTQGGVEASGAGGAPISSTGGLCIPANVLGADVTAPTLSSATAGTATSDGATSFGVSTDEGNGTLYWAIVTNGGSCTDAQLKAGSGGNIVAGKAGSQAVSSTGAQTVTSVTGLTASTTYQIKFLHRDSSGNDSSQASVSLTTTSAGDAYWSSVVLLLGNDNAANGSTTFTDQSAAANTMTGAGSIAYTNASAPTGMTTSIGFNGSTQYLTTPDSASWNFGSGDFTIEFMLKFDTVTSDATGIAQAVTATGNGSFILNLQFAGKIDFYYTTSGFPATRRDVDNTTWTPNTTNWYHIAVSRNGANSRLFIDGVQHGSTFNSGTDTLYNDTGVLSIGADQAGGGRLTGKMANIRVTKGVARYTANFTPPTLPLPTS